MSHDTGSPGAAWVERLIRTAWPETAGVTLAALDALAGREAFSARQVAYLMHLMMHVGAQARTAADEAELTASREVAFAPQPTREARISLRTQAMVDQHALAWLRRTGGPPPAEWEGGTAEQAAQRYMWGDET